MTSHFHLNWSKGRRKNCIQILWHSATPELFLLWPWAEKPSTKKEKSQKDINTSRKLKKAGETKGILSKGKKCIITAICITLSKNKKEWQTRDNSKMCKQIKWVSKSGKAARKGGRCEKLQRGNQSNLHASKLQTGNEEKWKIQK